jgi:uncharacterized protein (TIGR02271 family)
VAFTSDDIARLTGATVLDPADAKVGKISQVYIDPDGAPSWATIRAGFLGSSELFFPLDGAAFVDRDVRVPFSKESVQHSPRVESGEELTPEEADELVDYYSGSSTGTDLGASATGLDGDAGGTTTDTAMTRSEERLKVGTRSVERGRVRLRKYVVTEQQTVTVPVRHEEATLVREPVTEADLAAAPSGRELAEEEHEIVLHGEVVTVAKDVVPVERVRLGTREVTEQQQITDDVRVERIEFTGPDGATR